MPNSAIARACANIAFIKYWGKQPASDNRAAVPSLSLTLAGLSTETEVEFDSNLSADQLVLGRTALEGRPLERVKALLDRVRAQSPNPAFARVQSRNDFPTGAGLASSASGFCALALAASSAAGIASDAASVSALARKSSASAARSAFGGFSVLRAGADAAEPLLDENAWPLALLVTLTAKGPKAVGSTEGMLHTERTSPYYATWVTHAPKLFEQGYKAVLERDLERLGAAMEQSTLMMHASMLAAAPHLLYMNPVSVRVIETVTALRKQGTHAYFTLDAGPHVKVLTTPELAASVRAALLDVEGVQSVIETKAGPGATLVR
jgi:diphosphomevalonate decarboxylase